MVRQDLRTYEEAVEYLLNIPRFTKKNSMEDTKAFLKRLGDPDKDLRILHVAGTNGKGSVCAYLRCMCEAAGLTTCVFTSPHLVDVRERFLIRGEMISKERFLEAFLAVYDKIPWDVLSKEDPFDEAGTLPEGFYHPTFFEYLFFMAMVLFREEAPDVCILETGLGGRLDATNAVSKKELSVITRISLDHMEYLGDTPELIAAEKAGIMAKGVPAVYLAADEGVTKVFEEAAAKTGAIPCPLTKEDYSLQKFQNKNIDFSLHTRYYKDISVTLHTYALYQMENAALAVRALEAWDRGRTFTAEHVKAGLANCVWPGRMEEVSDRVFVDGAHNEDGVRAFLESVRADRQKGEAILLFSAVKDKQYDKMMEEILSSGLFTKLYLVPLHSGRATSLETLKDLAVRLAGDRDVRIGTFDDVQGAMKTLLSQKKESERLYVAGSLYLVGEVKACLGVLKDDQL
ncbi:MAG: bifunctional folylpolyglutamate synthase/dihydrofolate synthase [Lachnospiraceae bacterium]|nr:bifunctional folylpolyglutamate synthase/dihydrofolate synthase [Lachnospiraceae bacterium]